MPRKEQKNVNKTKKTEIDLNVVMHVAKLARLNLTKQEAKKYQKDLNDILSAFKELKKVKANVPPSFHPLDVKDVFREDKEEQCLKREKALANTKHKEDGYFKGPRAV